MSEHRGAITHEGELYPSPRHATSTTCRGPARDRGTRARSRDGSGGRAFRCRWNSITSTCGCSRTAMAGRSSTPAWRRTSAATAWGTLESQYLGGRPLARIFITHDHPDHMGLSPWLAAAARCRGLDVGVRALRRRANSCADAGRAAADERIAAHLQSPRHADTGGRRATEPARTRRHLVRRRAAPRPAPVPTATNCRGAGRTWRLIETDGHCRGHLCLHDAADDVLISGDQVLPCDLAERQRDRQSAGRRPAARFPRLARAAASAAPPQHARAAVARTAVPRPAAAHRRRCARITCSSSTRCGQPASSRARRTSCCP